MPHGPRPDVCHNAVGFSNLVARARQLVPGLIIGQQCPEEVARLLAIIAATTGVQEPPAEPRFPKQEAEFGLLVNRYHKAQSNIHAMLEEAAKIPGLPETLLKEPPTATWLGLRNMKFKDWQDADQQVERLKARVGAADSQDFHLGQLLQAWRNTPAESRELKIRLIKLEARLAALEEPTAPEAPRGRGNKGGIRQMARDMGIPESTLRCRLKAQAQNGGSQPDPQPLTLDAMDAARLANDELKARLMRQEIEKLKHENEEMRLRLKSSIN
jgi:hypothetical protein